MISVLITGSEPFGGRDRNLSWDVAAEAASCDSFKDWVKAVRLPVSFRKVTEIVSGLLQYMKPDIMLMLGMAAKRERISVSATTATDPLSPTFLLNIRIVLPLIRFRFPQS
ncbi:MAG TPA: hypothetical protein IAC03_04560 [Candidatus Coprenecus pullistercoris]|nr:hypothetical protein [Candidatus Coprenecus pullistercoris]